MYDFDTGNLTATPADAELLAAIGIEAHVIRGHPHRRRQFHPTPSLRRDTVPARARRNTDCILRHPRGLVCAIGKRRS